MEGAKDLPNNSEPTKKTPNWEKTKKDDLHILRSTLVIETHMDLKGGEGAQKFQTNIKAWWYIGHTRPSGGWANYPGR